MCGIAGILSNKSFDLKKETCDQVFSSLYHRGPDDRGWFTYGNKGIQSGKNAINVTDVNAALLHTRLSIIDLTAAGHQPMVSHDKRYVITFNGEIYNYIELREELLKKGYMFRTHTDSEVLLYWFIEYGVSGLDKLEGMFAFAILDTVKSEVYLVRDFFGIKPLFYTLAENKLHFASEVKTLLTMSNKARELNPENVFGYLRFGLTNHHHETLFKGIFQLPAAHYIKVDLKKEIKEIIPQRYWSADVKHDVSLSFNEAAEKLRELFLDNVKKHLRSDVNVGAALSGGIDSSAIVCAMRYLEPDMDIHTFSYIADDKKISEEKWADIVNQHIKAHAHKIRFEAKDLFNDIDKLIQIQDEPFGSTSIYAQTRVFKCAKEHDIKVMLDGQGADEILAGYDTYLSAFGASLIRQNKYLEFAKYIANLKNNRGYVLKGIGEYFVPKSLQNLFRSFVGQSLIPSWMNKEWFTERNIEIKGLRNIKDKYVLKESLRLSIEDLGLFDLLRYEDRNSMAYSIESRVPFLTPGLINFLFSLPEEYIIDKKTGARKFIFRKAMQGIVPESILQRTDKIGFQTPEKKLFSSYSKFVQEAIANFKKEHKQKDFPVNFSEVAKELEHIGEQKRYANNFLWRTVNLLKWIENFYVSL